MANLKGMQFHQKYELRALNLLLREGYTLIAKDYRVGHHQADLVVKKLNVLYVVEVKYRKTIPEEAWQWVTSAQFYRLLKLGAGLLREHQCSELQVLLVGFSNELDTPRLLLLDVN